MSRILHHSSGLFILEISVTVNIMFHVLREFNFNKIISNILNIKTLIIKFKIIKMCI